MLYKNCLVCGKEFVKGPNISVASWFGNKRRPLGVQFCSKECLNINKKGKHPSPSTQFKKGNVSWLTGTRGVAKPNSGSFKKGNTPWTAGKHLSPEHYQKLKDAGFFNPKFAEKSGNWKGGITKLAAAIRTTMEYKIWHKSVFERDGYKCIECGGHHIPGNRLQLHSHHIIPFYQLLETHHITTLDDARNCKELWDINNGKTLCIPCHKQTDSYLVNQYNKNR